MRTGRPAGVRPIELVGAAGGGSFAIGGRFGDGFFIIIDDCFEGEVELIEAVFLDDVTDVGQVIGIGAVACSEDA